ncbi:MAG: hypothetical protein IT504_09870, partial [Burkholderiaceae bacterium]|nr:hypothetical protein [Burkholderiaceae bacterium]
MSRSSTVNTGKRDERGVRTLLRDILAGYRMSDEDALMLFSVNDRRIWQIAASADEKREKVTGSVVTFVKNQNINVTNYCINSCGFCGFSKKEGEEGGYLSSRDEIRNKAVLARQRNVTEICTV